MVEKNVLYGIRGASIYIEDGNELYNTFKDNVVSCPSSSQGDNGRCKLLGVSDHGDSDFNEQSGIYALSPTNHFIGNRVSSMENALYFNRQGGRDFGIGSASGRTCIEASPYGTIDGNNFHNNVGFGFYTNTGAPRNVALDDNGFVTDWDTCQSFNLETGADNGFNVVVTNHVEYLENFSMGVYYMSDLSFVNTVAAMNNQGLYWKTYKRSPHSLPLCLNCTFVDNTIQASGPGGSGLVEFATSRFHDTGRHSEQKAQINHHCRLQSEATGGFCASHYDFNSVEFTGSPWKFVSESDQSDAVIYYGGNSYFLTNAHVVFDTSACWVEHGFYVCPGQNIRNVRLYSPNRGVLQIRNVDESGSYQVGIFDEPKVQDGVAYTPNCGGMGPTDCASQYGWPGGYTFIVKSGQEYHITLNTYSGPKEDLFTMEYGEFLQDESRITIEIAGDSKLAGRCEISSKHDRAFITPYGPIHPQTGAWWDCVGPWNTLGNKQTYIDAIYTPDTCNSQSCSDVYVSTGSVVYDNSCYTSSVPGCSVWGKQCCRHCDTDGYNLCSDRNAPFTTGSDPEDTFNGPTAISDTCFSNSGQDCTGPASLLTGVDLASCAQACWDSDSCVGFSLNAAAGHCYLKTSCSNFRESSAWIYYDKSDFSNNAWIWDTQNLNCWPTGTSGTDYSHGAVFAPCCEGSVSHSASSLAECQALCDSTCGCSCVTYGAGQCYLRADCDFNQCSPGGILQSSKRTSQINPNPVTTPTPETLTTAVETTPAPSSCLDTQACAGNDCYTCRSRRDWLVNNRGQTEEAANAQIYAEFPSACDCLGPDDAEPTTNSPTVSPTYSPTKSPSRSPTFSPTYSPTSSPINPTSCLESMACDGTECFTCVARRDWLVHSGGLTEETANGRIFHEFPTVCSCLQGPTRKPTVSPTVSPTYSPTGSPVISQANCWAIVACDGSDCHTCKARMDWLISQGSDREAASTQVASEFQECDCLTAHSNFKFEHSADSGTTADPNAGGDASSTETDNTASTDSTATTADPNAGGDDTATTQGEAGDSSASMLFTLLPFAALFAMF